MIGIRVDANEKIAMGHLMRCMSIAKQLKERDLDVVFLLSENYAGTYISKNGFSYICLRNQYDEKEQETERIKQIIREKKIKILLIDSYKVTYGYMSILKQDCKIVYIDDLNLFRYPADLIINYTYGTDRSFYESKGYEEEQFLTGSDYIPLRSEFSQKRIAIQKEIKALYIATGGTDEYNVIVSLLKKMQKSLFRNTVKYVVAGRFYKNRKELEQICLQDHTVCVYYNIENVCSIMRKSDLAISAGGTTLMELFACGIPTVCFSIADNQLPGIRTYLQNGLLLYAGDVRSGQDAVINKMVEQAALLGDDDAMRERMAVKAKSIVDGKGAERIAEAVKALY